MMKTLDPKDELSRSFLIDNSKNWVWWRNFNGKNLHSTEWKIEPFAISTRNEKSAKDKILMEYEQSFLQDLETFLGTMRIEEDVINFFTQNYSSNFDNYEIPPDIYEVSASNITSINSVEANVSFDITTMKLQIKKNNVLRFD